MLLLFCCCFMEEVHGDYIKRKLLYVGVVLEGDKVEL
jgi:hypothetical protein